jgi:uncharacterized protein involved in exopolysaccharide biosynthesis
MEVRAVEADMDVQRLLLVLRRWWPIIVVGTLLAAGAAFLVSQAQPKTYQSEVLLRVNSGLPAPGGGGDFNQDQAAWGRAATDARLVPTTLVAQAALGRAGAHLSRSTTVGTLLKNTAATAPPQYPLIYLDVRASDARDAALLAQAMADSFIARDREDRMAGVAQALRGIDDEIARVSRDSATAQQQNQGLLQARNPSPSQRDQSAQLDLRITQDQATLSDLQNRRGGIKLAVAGVGSTITIEQPAQTPSVPIAPRTAVNVLVAAVLTLLALLGIAVLGDALGKRPRTDDQTDTSRLGEASAVPPTDHPTLS